MDPSLAAGIVFILTIAAAAIIYIRFFQQPEREDGLNDVQSAIQMRFSPFALFALVAIVLALSGGVYLLHLLLDSHP